MNTSQGLCKCSCLLEENFTEWIATAAEFLSECDDQDGEGVDAAPDEGLGHLEEQVGRARSLGHHLLGDQALLLK